MLMGDNTADVIVVGGGVMGCAAAYQLAKDGQRVILLEQYTIGNRLGSSHGASRLFSTGAYQPGVCASGAHGLLTVVRAGKRIGAAADAAGGGPGSWLT